MTNELSDATKTEDLLKINLITSTTEKEVQDDVVATETDEHLEYDPAVDKILDGFKCFKTNYFNTHPELFNELALGQNPKFLVFACSDSRVSPSHVLHFQPGDAFLVRNIANLVPKFDQIRYSGTGATLEYAVEELGVENILVMGHSGCGGIKRLMSYPEDGSAPLMFIDDWVEMGLPVKTKVIAEQGNTDFLEQCESCAKGCINMSLDNLLTYPFVQKAYSEKKLALTGGYYDFFNGRFELWEFGTNIIITTP
ncbi:hypothetical protein M0R45_020010 [Rubus argutus]|uniref:Carbonic anhydrase n=1 Tax=Rubus argutus TaxID=59490 RepID=A0AAW1XAC1_RUBAR